MNMTTTTIPGKAGKPMDRILAIVRHWGWDGGVYAFTILCGLVLALTGLGTYFFSARPMTGLMLMLHATVAPPFAIGMALTALTFADRCRFTLDEGERFDGLQKLLFWLILPCAVIVILSAVFPMTPLFGTHGQELLYRTHQLSSLWLTMFVAVHATRFFRSK
jgi:hypothetical protein